MFGLTFEKLLLITALAGVVMGPQRLPHYAHQFAELVRAVRETLETTRGKAEEEMGISLSTSPWEGLDVRQYDPRRIVREALVDPAGATATATAEDTERDAARRAALQEAAAHVRPGQRYVTTGSAAHPRRTLIASLPADDPRRLAAEAAPLGDHGASEDAPQMRRGEPSSARLSKVSPQQSGWSIGDSNS